MTKRKTIHSDKLDSRNRDKVTYGCKLHKGEHPFYYKETINGFVTYCGEVWDDNENYPSYWGNPSKEERERMSLWGI